MNYKARQKPFMTWMLVVLVKLLVVEQHHRRLSFF